MADKTGNPVREALILGHGRGYAGSDLLLQSIWLCAGLWALDGAPPEGAEGGAGAREAFRAQAYARLAEEDPAAAEAFQVLDQVRLDPETFVQLLRHWGRYAGCRAQLRRLTERLVAHFLTRNRRTWYHPPSWLVRLAVELLAPTEGICYDGAGGAGSAALEAARYSARRGGRLELVTREADPLLFALSVLRAAMHGVPLRQTRENCLRAPLPSPPADCSVMLPPPGGGEPVPVADGLLCGSDWSFAFHQLSALGETGRGVCLLPAGALFNARNLEFRRCLLRRNVIDAVITLPRRSGAVASAPAALVVFRKGRREDDGVMLLEAPDVPPAAGVVRWITDCYRRCRAGLERVPPPSALDAENLSPGRYLSVPAAGDAPPEEGGPPAADWRPLGEWAEIRRGINVARGTRSEEGVRVLRLADVRDGVPLRSQAARYVFPRTKDLAPYLVREGDLLISCKGAAIKLCLVPALEEPLVLSHDFLGVRTDPERLDPRYLLCYLRSGRGQRELARSQVGSSIPMIRAADLERLPFPYIPPALQRRHTGALQAEVRRIQAQIQALNRAQERAYQQFCQAIGLTDEEKGAPQ